MADRFPLILNTSANQIQEIASGDTLDLTDVNISNAGVITATSFAGDGSGLIGVASTDNIVTGTAATFNNTVDINADLDVDGHTNLDNLSVAGVSTFTGKVFTQNNLGIRNTSANAPLHVTSPDTGGGNIAYFDDSGSGNTGRLMILTTGGAATDGIRLQGVNRKYIHFGNATSKITIDNNNSRTGINSSIPTVALDVVGSGKFSGDLDVDSHTNLDNVSVAGVTTFTGDATFSANVSIGGTLTYEDVTNIDSVGIITARSDVKVGTGVTLTPAGAGFFAGIVTATQDINIGEKIVHNGHPENYISFPGTGIGANDTLLFTMDNDGVARFVNGQTKIGPDANSPTTSTNYEFQISGYSTGNCFALSLKHNTSGVGKNLRQAFFFKNSGNTSVDLARFQATCTSNTAGSESGNLAFYTTNAGTSGERLNINPTGINVTGVCTATSFVGNGSGLTNIGISTEQVTPSSNVATLDLSKDEHKIVASGTYTIDVNGGTESESHVIRIENSGISTVGFSTYFKFPSGGTPALPTASGAISLISFTVHKVGSVGIATVLLAGASVNYS